MSSVHPLGPIAGACCLLYFFGWLFARRAESLQETFDSLPAAAGAVAALLIAPFCFYGAWHQFGAADRLERAGLPAAPDFGYAVGAQGGREPRGIWRFAGPTDPKPVLAFYAEQGPAHGWKVDRRKNGIRFEKPGHQIDFWSETRGDKTEFVFQRVVPPPAPATP